MWPVGVINNGNLDLSLVDLAFGIKLNNSNVADWTNAQIYISFDLNANGGIIADSTFVPFAIPLGSPAFAGSPVTGIPSFGDETTNVFTNTSDPNTLNQVFGAAYIFIPAVGTSLQGSANFTNGSWVIWDRNTGQMIFAINSTCNP